MGARHITTTRVTIYPPEYAQYSLSDHQNDCEIILFMHIKLPQHEFDAALQNIRNHNNSQQNNQIMGILEVTTVRQRVKNKALSVCR